jgi:hypothetical protein
LDNGWVLDKDISAISPGRSEHFEIKRNGMRLSIEVSNRAAYKTSPANCAVCSFTSLTCPVILPTGIEPGVTDEYEFDLKVGSLFAFEGKTYFNGREHYLYRHRDEKKDSNLDMQFFFNADNRTLSGIRFVSTRWDY